MAKANDCCLVNPALKDRAKLAGARSVKHKPALSPAGEAGQTSETYDQLENPYPGASNHFYLFQSPGIVCNK